MTDKTKEELETELQIRDVAEKERKISDKLYAVKLVERVVWGLVALVLTAFALGMIALVIPK
jgi:hypothetical protein